jgi:hypothetical protein
MTTKLATREKLLPRVTIRQNLSQVHSLQSAGQSLRVAFHY